MHWRAQVTIVGLLSILVPTVHAQNGKIIDQQVFTVEDSVGNRLRRMAPDTLAAIEQVEMRDITYLSDGLRVKGFVITPKKEGRYPVIIFNRGGCKDFGAMTHAFVARWLPIFASWGYVVVASQYRGKVGGEGKDEFGGADVNDVLNLLPLIDSLPKADRTRIGMWGWSRGGLMTYLALARTDRIRAAVIGGAPTDLSAVAAQRKAVKPDDNFEDYCLRGVIPAYERNRQRELDARSPIKWPEKLNRNTPILLLHGSSDWRAAPQHSLDMATALLKVKQPFRLVLFEGGDHDLTEYLPEADRMARDWLDRYVRDRKTWPSMEPHGQ
jgi:dipeptidyl aminopeptidase/acylaminoacyl peptidase